VHGRTSQTGRDYGMTTFRRRLRRSLDPTSKEEEVKKTWPSSARAKKGKDKGFHQER
jgi:hypothetical protein